MKGVVSPRGPILRELALAATAGVVFAVGPFTPNEVATAAAAGLVVGGGVLAWRLRRESPVWHEPDTPLRLSRDQLLAGAALLLCLAAFAPTIQWMYLEWTRSVWFNDHGLFIPFVMAWFTQRELRKQEGVTESSAFGFAPLVAGLALSVLDTNVESRYLASAGLLLALSGLALLFFGPRRTWALRIPLALGVLMIPVPYSVAAPLGLRTLTASGVLPLLDLMGFSAIREGTLIHMPPSQSFIVADACSGANTLWASMAVAIVLAVTSQSLGRRVALLLSAPLLAIAANTVRVTLLVLLTRRFGVNLLETPVHEATGVATFVGVLVPLMMIAQFNLPKQSPP